MFSNTSYYVFCEKSGLVSVYLFLQFHHKTKRYIYIYIYIYIHLLVYVNIYTHTHNNHRYTFFIIFQLTRQYINYLIAVH